MNDEFFTANELKLIEVLKKEELTKSQARLKGLDISLSFLNKCDCHGILIYESDEDNYKKKFGIISKN